jgi:hypothetical protein
MVMLKLWRMVDFVLSCTLYPAAVVVVWRSIWQIMDLNDQVPFFRHGFSE